MAIIKNWCTVLALLVYYTSISAYSIKTDMYTPKPITVFIHGTLPPALDKLVHQFDIPLGLTPALAHGNKYYMGRIPFIVSTAQPTKFPLDRFYLYGWSGDLSFAARKQAAHTLYHALKNILKKYPKSPITLIGHSHGGNVALNLAAIAQEHNDQQFTVDQLVLLAVPIQQATVHYAHSPIFKTIYSLYSFNDLLQIVDPQGLYTMPKKAALSKTEHCWFSQRIFTQAPHVIQANLSINRRQPSHIAFISAHFMTLLPQILQTLSTLAKKAQLEHKEPHFTLNIVTYPTYQYTADYNIPGIL